MVHMLWPKPDEGAVTQPEPASLRLFHRHPEPFSSPYALYSLVVHLPSELFHRAVIRRYPDLPNLVVRAVMPALSASSLSRTPGVVVLSRSRLREGAASPSFRDFRVNSLNALHAHAATGRAWKSPSAASCPRSAGQGSAEPPPIPARPANRARQANLIFDQEADRSRPVCVHWAWCRVI